MKNQYKYTSRKTAGTKDTVPVVQHRSGQRYATGQHVEALDPPPHHDQQAGADRLLSNDDRAQVEHALKRVALHQLIGSMRRRKRSLAAMTKPYQQPATTARKQVISIRATQAREKK